MDKIEELEAAKKKSKSGVGDSKRLSPTMRPHWLVIQRKGGGSGEGGGGGRGEGGGGCGKDG